MPLYLLGGGVKRSGEPKISAKFIWNISLSSWSEKEGGGLRGVDDDDIPDFGGWIRDGIVWLLFSWAAPFPRGNIRFPSSSSQGQQLSPHSAL